MKTTMLIILSLFLMSNSLAWAHGDEEEADTTSQHVENTNHQEASASVAEELQNNSSRTFAPFSEFPNLHPLVVHFPIVLLLLAFLTQLISFFSMKKELGWVTLGLLAGAFIGALLASNVFHAHAHNLSPEADKIFELHETLASWTTWLAGAGMVLKGLSLFLLSQKLWMEIAVFVVILGAAAMVSFTGHLGSQMVYIEQIGPGGKYLEQENH